MTDLTDYSYVAVSVYAGRWKIGVNAYLALPSYLLSSRLELVYAEHQLVFRDQNTFDQL